MDIFKGKYYLIERATEPARLVQVLEQKPNRLYKSEFPLSMLVLLAIEPGESGWTILTHPDDTYELPGNPYGTGDFKEVTRKHLPLYIDWNTGTEFLKRFKI